MLKKKEQENTAASCVQTAESNYFYFSSFSCLKVEILRTRRPLECDKIYAHQLRIKTALRNVLLFLFLGMIILASLARYYVISFRFVHN